MDDVNRSYIHGVAALIGTTIGAGIFGIPYVMAQSGALVGLLWIFGLGFILVITNLLHGEFSLRTRDDVRFVGIAKKYLSPRWGKYTGYLTIVSYYGSLLAYIIIGGQFLNIIFTNIIGTSNIGAYTFLYFAITSFVLFHGVGFLKNIELPMVFLLIVSLLGLSVIAGPHIQVENWLTMDLSKALLPYGVVLFSLSSISAIPTIEDIMNINKKKLKRAIITAGVISTIIVAVFGLAVVGVSGTMTSQDAIAGLSGSLGRSIIMVGAIIGFLAIITSHLVIGHHLREIYIFDYRIRPSTAWLLVVTVPYLLFSVLNVNFIDVIGFVGGVIGGITGNLVGYISLRSHEAKTREPEYCIKHDNYWAYAVMVVYTLGIIYQLYYTFLR